MHCPNLEQLAAYQSGMPDTREHEAIRCHLEGCAACRQELAALARTDELLTAMPEPIMPADLWQGVAWRLEAQPRRPRFAFWQTIAGAGVVASLLFGAVLLRVTAPQSLPTAPPMTASFTAHHDFLAAQDPLADRASLGVMLIAQEERR